MGRHLASQNRKDGALLLTPALDKEGEVGGDCTWGLWGICTSSNGG